MVYVEIIFVEKILYVMDVKYFFVGIWEVCWVFLNIVFEYLLIGDINFFVVLMR